MIRGSRAFARLPLMLCAPGGAPLFSEDSLGYRPGRGAKDAIFRIKEYIGQGYTRAVVLDLSKLPARRESLPTLSKCISE